MSKQMSSPVPPLEILTVRPEYALEFPSPTVVVPSLRFFRAWCGNPNKRKGEGFYYRLVRRLSDNKSCLQLILYYRVQWLPYHPNDFTPVFIYFESDGEISHIAYDYFHHSAATITTPDAPALTVVAPWHAFKYGRQGWPTVRMQTVYHAMRDSVVLRWWFLQGKAQLKLRSKLVDPWNTGLMEQSGNSQPTFRDEGRCPVCDRIVQMDTMHINGSMFSKACRCSQGHRFTVYYDAQRQVIESRYP